MRETSFIKEEKPLACPSSSMIHWLIEWSINSLVNNAGIYMGGLTKNQQIKKKGQLSN